MKKYVSQTLTIENSKEIGKPNEDLFLVDDAHRIYILLDGVSRDLVNGIYPNPSPSRRAAEIFAQAAYRHIISREGEASDFQAVLFEAAEAANLAVAAENHLNYGGPDYFLPGTVGILTCIKDDTLYYAYNGDCLGVLVGEERLAFTQSQTKNVAARRGEYTARQIRGEICNSPSHPCAYGVFNGDPAAMKLVRTGAVDLAPFRRVLLYTDGFENTLSGLGTHELLSVTPRQIEAMSRAEKNADDRTVIIIDIYD